MNKEFNTSIDQIADLIMALRKERDYYEEKYLALYSKLSEIYKEEFLNLGGKPLSETSLLKTFTDVFNELMGPDRNDVEEISLFERLMKTGKFTLKEAKEHIRKAMQNGQIYESRAGFYKKA